MGKIVEKRLSYNRRNQIKIPKDYNGVSKFTRSRLTYELARETFLIEDLRTTLLLPSTENAEKHLMEMKKKRNEIPLEFYGTDAMTDRTWTSANQKLRHVVVKLAIHGYHHKICKNTSYHDANNNCVCSLCGELCEKYHITKCKNNRKSISDYRKD